MRGGHAAPSFRGPVVVARSVRGSRPAATSLRRVRGSSSRAATACAELGDDRAGHVAVVGEPDGRGDRRRGRWRRRRCGMTASWTRSWRRYCGIVMPGDLAEHPRQVERRAADRVREADEADVLIGDVEHLARVGAPGRAADRRGRSPRVATRTLSQRCAAARVTRSRASVCIVRSSAPCRCAEQQRGGG